jgi:hypothetical protein
MANRILAADARAAALEDCENKIRTAFRRGLQATCDIAKELGKILREELYTVKTSDFVEYVTFHMGMDIRTYRRIVAVSQTVAQLQEAGLKLPANQAQAEELSRLESSMRPGVWNSLVLEAERLEKSLTAEDVKRAVEATERQRLATKPPEPGGIEISMDTGDNGSAKPGSKKGEHVQEGQLAFTEKGEAALQRIRKVCGKEIAEAILDGRRALSERELRNWAEFDDEMMKSLTYFINQGWTVAKAVAFQSKSIEGSTDVDDLLLIANSRGGTTVINYHDLARITVELVT